MELFGAIIFVVFFIIIFVSINFISGKPKKILRFVKRFYANKVLSTIEYDQLKLRYNNLFSLFEPFPDDLEYPRLYKDEKFERFVDNHRKIRKYFFVLTLVLLLLVTIFTPKEFHYP
jgi:pilus assembly protein TadC